MSRRPVLVGRRVAAQRAQRNIETLIRAFTIFKRTGVLVASSRAAMIEAILAASPSNDPTATLSVVGRS
jgi:hypothetical protein